MVFAKAALARFATRQAARDAAERLEREGFIIRRIPAPSEQRIVTGATRGWYATPATRPRARLATLLDSLVAKLHGTVTLGELYSLDIPPEAVTDHIVVISGTPEEVQHGVQVLRKSNELLDLDLY